MHVVDNNAVYVYAIPAELPHGSIVAEHSNPASCTASCIQEIWDWRRRGGDMKDAIERLRPKIVPPGYACHTWKPGMPACTCYIYECDYYLIYTKSIEMLPS